MRSICEDTISMVAHGNYAGNKRNKDVRRMMDRENVVGSMDGSPSGVEELRSGIPGVTWRVRGCGQRA